MGNVMFGVSSSTVIPSYSNQYPDLDLYATTGVNKPATTSTSKLNFGYQNPEPVFYPTTTQAPAPAPANATRNTITIVLVALGVVLVLAAVAAA